MVLISTKVDLGNEETKYLHLYNLKHYKTMLVQNQSDLADIQLRKCNMIPSTSNSKLIPYLPVILMLMVCCLALVPCAGILFRHEKGSGILCITACWTCTHHARTWHSIYDYAPRLRIAHGIFWKAALEE